MASIVTRKKYFPLAPASKKVAYMFEASVFLALSQVPLSSMPISQTDCCFFQNSISIPPAQAIPRLTLAMGLLRNACLCLCSATACGFLFIHRNRQLSQQRKNWPGHHMIVSRPVAIFIYNCRAPSLRCIRSMFAPSISARVR